MVDTGSQPQREFFVGPYLDPAERLNEILFGLIMVLTITLSAGIATSAGAEARRELLIAAIGCNIAWGNIDGAMFLMARLLERRRSQRALRALHDASDDATALAIVADAVDEAIGGDVTAAATPEERMRLLKMVRDMALRVQIAQPQLRREDLVAALFSAALVMLTAVPAVVPFLLIDAPRRALRLSNLLLLCMLFLVGYQWGKHSYSNPWRSGVAVLIIGMALVGAPIALGG